MKSRNNEGIEPVIVRWYHRIGAASKTAFLSAFISGLLTHLYIFTSRYTNEDDIWCLMKTEADTGSGRWFNNILNNLRLDYTPPMLIGVLMIVFIALAAGLTAYILKMRKGLTGALTGILMATYPAIAYTAGYLYAADGYFLSMLLSVLAVYLLIRFKRTGFLSGAVVLTLSLAIYQGYITMAISLCLAVIFLQIIDTDKSWKQVGILAGKALAMGILAYVFYLISVQISIRIAGITLTSYKGLDSLGRISLFSLPSALVEIYKSVFAGYLGNVYHIPAAVIAFSLLALLIAAVFYVMHMKKNGFIRKPARLIISLVVLLLLPVGLYTAPIFMAEAEQSMLIMYALVLPFVFILALYDNAGTGFSSVLQWTLVISLLVVAAYNIVVCNIYYEKLDILYQRTYSLNTRVLARVEELLDDTDTKQVAIVGMLPNENYGDSSIMFDEFSIDQGIWGQFIGYNNTNLVENTSKFISFADTRLGVRLNMTYAEEMAELIKLSPDLPRWPEEGSVLLVGSIIMVNIGYPSLEHTVGDNGNVEVSVRLPVDDESSHKVNWVVSKDGAEYDAIYESLDKTVSFDLTDPGSYVISCLYRNDNSNVWLGARITIPIE